MHRQTFVSTDFFLAISEAEACALLASLPGHLSQLTLLKEDKVVHATRFLYRNEEKGVDYHVDVSLCRLDGQYLRFGLHGSHANGQQVQSEAPLLQALRFFEKAVKAAFHQNLEALRAEPAPRKQQTWWPAFLSLFLSKYHY